MVRLALLSAAFQQSWSAETEMRCSRTDRTAVLIKPGEIVLQPAVKAMVHA
jgi:hypothetical protein